MDSDAKYAAVVTAMENAPDVIVPLIRELPIALLKRRPAPQRWTAHEHFCHLSMLHPMFNQRLDAMLQQDMPEIVPYFPDAEQQDGSLLDMDLELAIERYVRERTEFVERLKALSPAQWERGARHGEYNRYTIFIMCRHVAMHDLLHGYRMEQLLLLKEWPQ